MKTERLREIALCLAGVAVAASVAGCGQPAKTTELAPATTAAATAAPVEVSVGSFAITGTQESFTVLDGEREVMYGAVMSMDAATNDIVAPARESTRLTFVEDSTERLVIQDPDNGGRVLVVLPVKGDNTLAVVATGATGAPNDEVLKAAEQASAEIGDGTSSNWMTPDPSWKAEGEKPATEAQEKPKTDQEAAPAEAAPAPTTGEAEAPAEGETEG